MDRFVCLTATLSLGYYLKFDLNMNTFEKGKVALTRALRARCAWPPEVAYLAAMQPRAQHLVSTWLGEVYYHIPFLRFSPGSCIHHHDTIGHAEITMTPC